MKKFTYLFSLVLLCYTTALLAATQSISVNLTASSPQFTRPLVGNPPSNVSTQVGCYYSVFAFTAPVSGTYTITATGSVDNFGCLYQNSFIASQPLMNCLRTNDDYDPINPLNKNYGITRALTAGVTYFLVSTMFYANTVGSYNVSISGPFTTPLPVELNNFKANGADKHVELSWETLSEQNCQGFDIERSVDGSSFTSIGYVASKSHQGNSTEHLFYQFMDENPKEMNYYRLAQKDLDGKITYSYVVQMANQALNSPVVFYPNPTTTDLHIIIQSAQDIPVTCQLIDCAGRIVKYHSFDSKEGANRVYMNTADLSTGMYILTTTLNGQLNSSDRIFKK